MKSWRILRKPAVSVMLPLLLCLGTLHSAPGRKKPAPSSKKLKPAKAPTPAETLSFQGFMEAVVRTDPGFQLILLDQLSLKYAEVLQLPASDFLVDITGEYSYSVFGESRDESRNTSGTIALSKLFPKTGTELELAYGRENALSSAGISQTSLSFKISQDIARNAFGRSTRKSQQLIRVQTMLARHQIVEAYEDYLASLLVIYLDWHRNEERRRAAEATLKEAKKIYYLTAQKLRYRIAYPYELQKSNLARITARQNLYLTSSEERSSRRKIALLTGLPLSKLQHSLLPPELGSLKIFKADAPAGARSGKTKPATRTRRMMKLLKSEGILNAEIARDNLLPSAQVFAGYEMLDDAIYLRKPDRRAFVGFTFQMNLSRSQEKARSKVAEIELRKAKLSNRKQRFDLKNDLITVRERLKTAGTLRDLSRERLTLARKILNAEYRNYRLGRSSLTELSQARIQVEAARSDSVEQSILTAQLQIELLRLEDRIVRKMPRMPRLK